MGALQREEVRLFCDRITNSEKNQRYLDFLRAGLSATSVAFARI
ncbi:hypothetical protein BV133_1302 [Blastochloris viridis]|uniref:Uncharacterized protein n=1 Tax=Blastochloris viridis TaxID=1079 RepID=A0A182D0E5_BLAVI|nr:hypothetical protein BV133_1302 [Blastochloris viridis]